MNKKILLICSALLVPTIAMALNTGATATSSVSGSIPFFSISANRGYTYTATVHVTNTGTGISTFDVIGVVCQPGYAYPYCNSGTPSPELVCFQTSGTTSGNVGNTGSSWIVGSSNFLGTASQLDQKTTLNPGASADVVFTINVPANAPSGTYSFAAVVWTPVTPNVLATVEDSIIVGTPAATATLTLAQVGLTAMSLLGFVGGFALLAL